MATSLRLPLLAGGLAALLAWVVPLGESPDELGHLRYAEVVAAGRLPGLGERGAEGYEAHQPPLGYLLPALVIAAASGVDVAPIANPSLDFHRSGSRAFLPPFANERDQRVLRAARLTQAIWAAVTVWIGLSLANGSPWSVPFLLAPQLLFTCAGLNNDAALVACSSAALLLLARFAETGRGGVGAGLLIVAALFVKGSALFLLAPVAVAMILAPPGEVKLPRRLASPRLLLVGIVLAGLALWAVINLRRFGSLMPPVPTARHAATIGELVAEPRWLGLLFRSFWAKFGWLNTPMPWPFYLWFGGASLLAIGGALRARSAAKRVLVSAVVANCVLVVAFLLTVDLQPQGRYLLPSVTALGALAASTGPSIRDGKPGRPRMEMLARAIEPISILLALAAVATIAIAYR